MPPLSPLLDYKAGTEAAHLRLLHGAAYFKAARSATTPSAEWRHTERSLSATATSDPLFRCAVVLQNEDSQPFITTHSCTIRGAQPGVVHIHMQ